MLDDALSAVLDAMDGDDTWLLVLGVLTGIAALAAIIWFMRSGRVEISRRVGQAETPDAPPARTSALRVGRVGGAMAELAAKIDPANPDTRKEFRHRLIQGGFYDSRAIAWFIGLRIVCAPLLGTLAAGALFLVSPDADTSRFATAALLGAGLGYIAPSLALDRRITRHKSEHLEGFPDFMDLMVVCCQAGLSMEAGVNRVARELALAYPSLARNLDITTLELRGGKSLGAAIDGLSKRLGISEAVSFATLLSQSEELGSSLTDSLRAYSADMRNKRLMKAEEKANALPALLVVPLTLFVFPVLMIVILLPVAISVATV